MQIKALVLSALLSATASAHSRRQAGNEKLFGCTTPEPTTAQLAVAAELAEQEAAANATTLAQRQSESIVVDVYFHVVATSESEADGYVSDAVLDEQFAKINADFAPSGISFVLKGTDKTVNSVWAQDGGEELAMKKALRKGDYKTLNVYFQTSLGGALGYCYFPDTVTEGSDDFYYDGCSIDFNTMPGGAAEGYNLGATVTHEIGHWFNLYHTFQGNACTGSGDLIADTPQQRAFTTGCPIGIDTCVGVAGVDPIHNYMDYSDDACYEEFTAGQQARMFSSWTQYRA